MFILLLYKNMFQAIEIWLRRFIEFWRKAAQQKYIKLVRISEEGLFGHEIAYFKQKLYDGKGTKASVIRGLFTNYYS